MLKWYSVYQGRLEDFGAPVLIWKLKMDVRVLKMESWKSKDKSLTNLLRVGNNGDFFKYEVKFSK